MKKSHIIYLSGDVQPQRALLCEYTLINTAQTQHNNAKTFAFMRLFLLKFCQNEICLFANKKGILQDNCIKNQTEKYGTD